MARLKAMVWFCRASSYQHMLDPRRSFIRTAIASYWKPFTLMKVPLTRGCPNPWKR